MPSIDLRATDAVRRIIPTTAQIGNPIVVKESETCQILYVAVRDFNGKNLRAYYVICKAKKTICTEAIELSLRKNGTYAKLEESFLQPPWQKIA